MEDHNGTCNMPVEQCIPNRANCKKNHYLLSSCGRMRKISCTVAGTYPRSSVSDRGLVNVINRPDWL